MKKLFLVLLALGALLTPADAQQTHMQALIVSSCGSQSLTAATYGYATMDTTGKLCDGSSGSGPTQTVGITPTDRTVTSATGSSQTVMAANASRHSLTIENTGNANCGVNPTGGTAAIGGAGTLTLAPLGSYTPLIPTLSAVTAICTSGQPLYANES